MQRGPHHRPRPAWQWAAGGVLLMLFGWFAFVRGTRVPLLGWIDLALHEFGHVATIPLPEVATAMMGNGTQTLVPLALAAVFAVRERDWLGTVVCLGWAATTLQDASVYIADAPHQRLQLIGGYHDWAYALGELGQLHRAEVLGGMVWGAGLLVWLVAVAGCATGPWIEPAIRPRTPADADDGPESGGRPDRADHDADMDADWRRYFG